MSAVMYMCQRRCRYASLRRFRHAAAMPRHALIRFSLSYTDADFATMLSYAPCRHYAKESSGPIYARAPARTARRHNMPTCHGVSLRRLSRADVSIERYSALCLRDDIFTLLLLQRWRRATRYAIAFATRYIRYYAEMPARAAPLCARYAMLCLLFTYARYDISMLLSFRFCRYAAMPLPLRQRARRYVKSAYACLISLASAAFYTGVSKNTPFRYASH